MSQFQGAPSSAEPSRAEKELRESERRLDQAQRMAHIGYWERDLDADRITWSDETYRIFGLKPRERILSLADLQELIHPDDRPIQARAVARAVRGEGPYDVEYRVVRPDGQVRFVHSLGEVKRDETGRARQQFGTVQDITERKKAEHALRTEKERFEKIATVAPGVILSMRMQPDGAFEVLYASPGVKDLFEFGPGELEDLTAIAGRLGQIIHPDDWPRFQELIHISACDLTPLHSEHRYQHRIKGERWVENWFAPVREPDGSTVWHGFLTDVTERKTLEEQFRHSQKMEAIGQLAGGVAHDFNNLLTVINACSELLLADIADDDERREIVAAVQDASQRAARLTGQLLAFSRKAMTQPRVLDLNALIDSIGNLLRRLIGEDVSLTTRLDPALSRVRMDSAQVEQVIVNLAVNAREAMPKGGRLSIETTDVDIHQRDCPIGSGLNPGRYVRLSVSDTGCGMTDKVKARLFEPFFTTKDSSKRSGLGLATVFGIVKQAAGDITVESRAGRGAAFVILLPAAAEPAAPVAADVKQLAPGGIETLLLAEDEEGVRKAARGILEKQGYTVLEAGTGADALRVVGDHPGPVHLLVTDVVMPDLGGRDLADAVRARRPDVKILYMSGYTDDAVIRHGVSQATDAFLQKPFTTLGLARKVRDVLDAHHAQE